MNKKRMVIAGGSGFIGTALATEWLARNHEQQAKTDATRDQFDQFLAARHAAGADDALDSADARTQLFQQFLKWQGQH